MPFQQALQLIAGPRGSRRKVRTDGRRTTDVAEEAICLKKPIVEDSILKGIGRVILPKRIQQFDGLVGVVHQQPVPGQQSANGTTGSTTQSHDLVLVPFRTLFFEELLQHPCCKSRVASATLAGDRNPPDVAVVLGHKNPLLFSFTYLTLLYLSLSRTALRPHLTADCPSLGARAP